MIARLWASKVLLKKNLGHAKASTVKIPVLIGLLKDATPATDCVMVPVMLTIFVNSDQLKQAQPRWMGLALPYPGVKATKLLRHHWKNAQVFHELSPVSVDHAT